MRASEKVKRIAIRCVQKTMFQKTSFKFANVKWDVPGCFWDGEPSCYNDCALLRALAKQ